METSPVVGIVMGSRSDLDTMRGASDMLERFSIPHEIKVISAHRTPDDALAYGKQAVDRGLRVIIAGAGAAAALPGVLAAVTPLPVIGVPISATKLAGVDALYSIVQMPSGVPVASVAIDGAKNAGLLAARILASGDEELTAAMLAYQEEIAEAARATSAGIE